MQTLELTILDGIQTHFRCRFLDIWMPVLSRLCDHGEIWIVLALLLLARRQTRRTGCVLILALLLNLVCCNMILKPWIGRLRPFTVRGTELLIRAPLDASFPSGHTSASFAATGALHTAGSRLWIPALALSVLIAFSRLYLYVHWPSDLLFGAVLGYLLGWLSNRIFNRCFTKKEADIP